MHQPYWEQQFPSRDRLTPPVTSDSPLAASQSRKWPQFPVSHSPTPHPAARRNRFLETRASAQEPSFCPGSLGGALVPNLRQLPCPHAYRTAVALRDLSDCHLVGNGPRQKHVESKWRLMREWGWQERSSLEGASPSRSPVDGGWWTAGCCWPLMATRGTTGMPAASPRSACFPRPLP